MIRFVKKIFSHDYTKPPRLRRMNFIPDRLDRDVPASKFLAVVNLNRFFPDFHNVMSQSE